LHHEVRHEPPIGAMHAWPIVLKRRVMRMSSPC
jgi:hypothetical protein